jgi:uncharacterized protein YjbI with pentapeptide repeats
MAKANQAGLKDIHFKNCKLVGFDFSACTDFLFKVEFENCLLDYAIFSRKNLKQTNLKHCSVREADFFEVDLQKANFNGCDLSGAQFENCNLQQADFSSAVNFTIDPERNKMKGARFLNTGLSGLLQKYNLIIE